MSMGFPMAQKMHTGLLQARILILVKGEVGKIIFIWINNLMRLHIFIICSSYFFHDVAKIYYIGINMTNIK